MSNNHRISKNDLYSYNAHKIIKYRRIINNTNNKVLRYFFKKRYKKLCYKSHCFIPIGAKIEENITFPHGVSGIFISNKAIIGKNAVIFQQVTIGSNSLKDSKKQGAPTIGNNVYIGAGAKIIGNIKIGDNVRIGANAVVVNNIPNNSTVVLNNIRVIEHFEERDNSFVSINDI